MHKDPEPGIFDLGSRPLRYTIGLGAVTGIVLSILAHVGILIWSADSGRAARVKANPSNLEASMTARRSTPPPTPAPTAAVRY
jgi:hypothetical protein